MRGIFASLRKAALKGENMTLGEKLSKLRRENNYTQEQLAEMLGVSRQAVSKWESGMTYPETEKLLKLGELYGCSMDYLLKDNYVKDDLEKDNFTAKAQEMDNASQSITLQVVKLPFYEKKSDKTIFGLPLYHINIGRGRSAKGIIAVGLCARGVISFGLLSLGIVSFGVFGIGIIAVGSIALGLLSAGAIAAGVIAFGAVSVAVVSVGACAVGDFSIGALSIGKYFARGDSASALIAVGDTKASGGLFEKVGELSASETEMIKSMLDENVPAFLSWAKRLIKILLRM